MVSPLGKQLYTITDTGYIVIYNSKYNYVDDREIMQAIIKYGKVILDDNFNAPIPFIIDGVSVLICGRAFNQQLNNLPCSLRILQIAALNNYMHSDFSKSLTNLPHGLEELRLIAIESSIVITKDLGYYLPSTLKFLCISSGKCEIDLHMLPDSIEKIYISRVKLNIEDVVKIPSNLKLFCGDSSDWAFREELKAKFPELEVKSDNIRDYWLNNFWNRI